MTAASWHFQRVCEEDLDTVLNYYCTYTETIRLFALTNGINFFLFAVLLVV